MTHCRGEGSAEQASRFQSSAWAWLGMAHYSPDDFRAVVRAALGEGVSYFDMQPDYGEAEKYLSPLVKEHRARLFVVTKTWEPVIVERDILPVAAKHDVGVVAMKALGGAVGLKYDTRHQRAMLLESHHGLAIRYVLGLPCLSCVVVGCKNAEEVRLAARVARDYRVLTEIEQATALTLGRKLAAEWGARYPEG